MNILYYCATILCFYAIGSFIANALRIRFPVLENVALSFLLGNTVVIFLYYYLFFFRLLFLKEFCYAIELFAFIYLLYQMGRILTHRHSAFNPQRAIPESQPAAPGTRFLLVCCLLIAFYAVLRTMNTSVNTNDALANWSFTAKVLYTEQTIYSDVFTDKDRVLRAKDYPFFISLTEAFMFNLGKGYDDKNIKVLFCMYYIAFMVIYYFRLRSLIDSPIAYLMSILLFSVPALIKEKSGGISSGIADVPLTLFHTGALLYLFDYLKISLLSASCRTQRILSTVPSNGLSHDPAHSPLQSPSRKSSLIVSSVLLSGTLFIKNEGALIYFALFIALIISILKTRYFRLEFLLFLAVPFAANLPWFYFKFFVAYPLQPYHKLALHSVGYLCKIGEGFALNMLQINDWGVIWLLPLCTLLYVKNLFKGQTYFILLFVVFHFISYIIILMIVQQQIQAALPIDRFLIHLLPESLFLFVLISKKR